MLTACVSSGGKTPPIAPEADPVIEVRHETRLVCPVELTTVLPARPSVPAGAVVEANAVGAAWLADDLAWAASVASLFVDAQTQCPDASAEIGRRR